MNLKKIGIVGAGTSGLITALILKSRFPKLKIKIIKSDKIGIIGVGEGSTEHWKEFIDFAKIDEKELIKETDATCKYGIYFKNWTDKDYVHNVSYLNNFTLGQYKAAYAFKIKNKNNLVNNHILQNNISINHKPLQYHFNTVKLNNYLIKICKSRNIKIVEDEITNVEVYNNSILKLNGKKNNYSFDFYIDSSGFKKILIEKLGAKWISYSKYLPMNEAIAFPTGDTEEYTPYTLSKAMTSGWMWRIPTYGRWGNGYVFNNNYINAEQAKKECEDYLKQKIEIGKNIKFEAGTIDKFWINNCCAIGLSSSFIEPLEATSIGTSIQQSFLLMHLIFNYNESQINLYNKTISGLIENIRDFVILHYLVNKKNSKFWKELKIMIPESLQEKLNLWKNRLPIKEDFKQGYLLFYESNFIVILHALGLINVDSIKKEFNNLSKDYKLYVNNWVLQREKEENNYIKHKLYLKQIRNEL